jgi:hypothetical protein
MNKHKKGMILSNIVMIVSLILIGNNIVSDQNFKIANIMSYLGMFLCGLFLFISHWKSYRKNNHN